MEAIIEFIFRYYDSETYVKEVMDVLFPRCLKLISTSTGGTDASNRKKYMFILSVNGMVGKEAQVVLATLSRLMASKMEEPVSYVLRVGLTAGFQSR